MNQYYFSASLRSRTRLLERRRGYGLCQVQHLVAICCLLLGLVLPGQAQIYYVLSDNSLMTRADELRRVNADGTGDAQVTTNFTDTPDYIAIDRTNNRAFVTEVSPSATADIYTINLTTGATTTFLSSASGVAGIAIDAANNYLYYILSDRLATTTADQLRRINLDGTNDVLLTSGLVNVPGAIALDAANNRLFVSDILAATPKIVSVNLSNNSFSTFLTSTANRTFLGLAVDAANGRLYYAVSDGAVNQTNDQLRRINLDGTGDATDRWFG